MEMNMKKLYLFGLILVPIAAAACSDSGGESSDDDIVADDDRGRDSDAGAAPAAADDDASDDDDFATDDDESSADDGSDDDGDSDYDDAADDSAGSAAPRDSADAEEDLGAVDDETQQTAEPDQRQFDAPGTNPFVYAEHDPLSTFAADVDTASYDIFRKDLGQGRLPPPDSVRLEEYVNYFHYDYPVPDADSEHPFTISLAAAPSLVDNGTQLLRVGIQGKELSDEDRRPTNLVFLVDVSGSMAASDKLPVVKNLMIDALAMMAPDDTISIVTYAGSTGVALEPTPASNEDTIIETISTFDAGGSTAGAAGIDLAYEQAAAGYLEGGVNHVVLCSDGDFNVGISNTDDLVEFIEEKRKTGITFTALGFGSGNLNDSVMEAISNAGNGTYAVIGSNDDAEVYVQERFFSSLQFIAKDVKLQVEFNPELVLAYRLLGYENRAIADEDFRDDKVDAGELGSGHRVTALYEVVLQGGSVPTPEGAPAAEDGEAYAGEREVADGDLVYVKVRYKDIDANALDEAYEVGVGLAGDAVAQSHRDLDDDFQWAFGIALFAEILKESPFADIRLMPQLQDIFAPQADRDDARSDFVELFEQSADLLGVDDLPPAETDGGMVGEPTEPDGGGGTSAEDAGVATSGDAGDVTAPDADVDSGE
jgi:Ca-activated chloride channel family protein